MIGALLILAGIFVSSSALIEFIRAVPEELRAQLLLGATLFRIGLVVLGIVTIVLGRMSIWTSDIQSTRPLSDASPQLHLAILAVVLLAATGLRLYGLDVGLWHDEILTYVKYVRLPFGEIISTYEDQNQHFLFTLLAHASFGMFGESAWALRLPSVLFGIASIWALYLFGRQVSADREALFAAALFAFSYHHIWFSQNARGYMGLLFWTILASWLLLRGLHEPQPRLWLYYAAAAALGVYTNTTMVFVIIGHFIIYCWTLFIRRQTIWPDRWAGFFLGFCLAGLFTFLLHALALPQMTGSLEESVVPAWKNPLWALLEFAKAMQIGFAGSVIAGGALLVFGAGLWSFMRTNPVVVQLLIIPAVICAAVVVGVGFHLWPRLFFFTFGFGALVVMRGTMLVGRLATRVLNWAPAKAVPIGTALCTGLVLVSAFSVPRAYAPKQDYLGALNFVQAKEEPGDAVVTVGLATYTYKNFYKTGWEDVKTLAALNSIRSQAKRTWLIYTFPPHVQSVYPDIMSSVEHDFTVQQKFYGTLGSGTIIVCRSDTPPSQLPRADVGVASSFRK